MSRSALDESASAQDLGSVQRTTLLRSSTGSLHPALTVGAALIVLLWVFLGLASPLFEPSASSAQGTQPLRGSVSLLPPLTSGAIVVGGADSEEDGSAGAGPRFVADKELAQIRGEETLTRKRFLLGTDRIGSDVAVNIARGARTSLLVGLIAASLAVTIGVGLGALAGISRSWIDNFLMRLVDAMMAFPLLLLVLLLDLLFDPGLFSLIVILGSTQWMGVARVVRAEMLRLRSEPFALAARAVGVRTPRLVLRHLLPNAMRPIVVLGLLLVGDSILLESTVSFLGFGTATDLPSWGSLVNSGRSFLREAWWISTFPGLAIVLVVASINLLGDAYLDRQDRTPEPTA